MFVFLRGSLSLSHSLLSLSRVRGGASLFLPFRFVRRVHSHDAVGKASQERFVGHGMLNPIVGLHPSPVFVRVTPLLPKSVLPSFLLRKPHFCLHTPPLEFNPSWRPCLARNGNPSAAQQTHQNRWPPSPVRSCTCQLHRMPRTCFHLAFPESHDGHIPSACCCVAVRGLCPCRRGPIRVDQLDYPIPAALSHRRSSACR